MKTKYLLSSIYLLHAIGLQHIQAAPLSEADIISLLQVGVPSQEVIEAITKNGYQGENADGNLARIRAAGADVTLLLTIRNQKQPNQETQNDYALEAVKSLMKEVETLPENPSDDGTLRSALRVLKGPRQTGTDKLNSPIDNLSDPENKAKEQADKLKSLISKFSEKFSSSGFSNYAYVRDLDSMTIKETVDRINAGQERAKNPWYYVGPGTAESGWARVFSEKANAYGYVDSTGAIMIPMKFEKAKNFSEFGLAAAKIQGKKWTIINWKGEEILPAEYDFISDFEDVNYKQICVFIHKENGPFIEIYQLVLDSDYKIISRELSRKEKKHDGPIIGSSNTRLELYGPSTSTLYDSACYAFESNQSSPEKRIGGGSAPTCTDEQDAINIFILEHMLNAKEEE